MRELWRRTTALVRKHPILWGPYLCAAILAAGLAALRRVADKWILHWDFIGNNTSHSILSRKLVETHFDEAAFIRTAERLHFVSRWAIRYLDDCLYAMAIISTALLINMVLSERNQRFREALAGLWSCTTRVLTYAAKGWMLSLCLMVFVSIPLSRVADKFAYSNRAIFHAMYYGVDVLNALCLAWVMAPLTIALLRRGGAAAVTAEEKRQGRYAYFLIQATAFALSLLASSWVAKLPLHLSAEQAAFDLSAIVTDLPFVPMYVAFALMARPELMASKAERPSSTVAFLKTLMPLHFGQGKEL